MHTVKQFRTKYNKEITLFAAGVSVGASVGLYALLKTEAGLQIHDVGLYEIVESGQKFVKVVLVNGTQKNYAWQSLPTS